MQQKLIFKEEFLSCLETNFTVLHCLEWTQAMFNNWCATSFIFLLYEIFKIIKEIKGQRDTHKIQDSFGINDDPSPKKVGCKGAYSGVSP